MERYENPQVKDWIGGTEFFSYPWHEKTPMRVGWDLVASSSAREDSIYVFRKCLYGILVDVTPLGAWSSPLWDLLRGQVRQMGIVKHTSTSHQS